MVSNKRKKIIIDLNMTISELSLIFLENKYNQISYNTYGNYQDRLKIINEYLGNIKLRDFRKDRINDFENYSVLIQPQDSFCEIYLKLSDYNINKD